MLPVFEIISYDNTQFGIIVSIILFAIFLFAGMSVPAMDNVGKRAIHGVPYIGGFLIFLSGFIFLGLSASLNPYISDLFNYFTHTISVIIIMYGFLKAFWY